MPIAGTTADLLYGRLLEDRARNARALPAGQYASVGAALLWTVEKSLGPDFTPETKAAWTEAYTSLAGG